MSGYDNCHHIQVSACFCFIVCDKRSSYFTESDTGSQGLYDKTSLRTMLAVIDYLRHQQRPLEADRFAVFLYLNLHLLFEPALNMICSCYFRLTCLQHCRCMLAHKTLTVSFLQQLLCHSVRLKLLAGAELPGGGQSCSVLLSTFHRSAVHRDLRRQDQS